VDDGPNRDGRHDRIPAISAVTVSFRRQRIGLYFHLHRDNITQATVILFLRYLLRQIPGPIMLLWDGGSIHTGEETRVFLARHRRLHVERFPAYAPELNPDERVWAHCKAVVANGGWNRLDELMAMLERVARKARRPPSLLPGLAMSITHAPLNSSDALRVFPGPAGPLLRQPWV
jgi:transposase